MCVICRSGDVELVAEGAEEVMEAFLAAIARHFAGHIEQTFVQDVAPGEYKGFSIRY